MALIGSTNKEKIWNYLKSKGFTDFGCAGLMGNLYAESGLKSNNLQNTCATRLGMSDEEYTKAVDNGTYTNFVKDSAGYGLAQWTYWSRKQNLLNYVVSKNKSIGDLEAQLDFLYKELSESYKSVFTTLKTATSLSEASNVVLTKFEKPANQSESVQKKRTEYGQIYYDEFANKANSVVDKGGNSMAVKIGHASIDERRKAKGGSAGDQTKKEVYTRDWYNKPWTSVIRPKSATVAEKIAKAMEQACANNNIGYDQNQRTTLYTQAKAKNWDLSKITTKCETDCSALVAVCVNAAGIAVSKDIYTGNELTALKNTGKFTVYTSSTYVSKSANLKRGDILLGKGHTAIVLSNGSNITSTSSAASSTTTSLNKTVKWNGLVTAKSLNVRKGAGTSYAKCSFSPLTKGKTVGVCDTVKASNGDKWYYIKVDNKYGFVHSDYIAEKVAKTVKYKTTANLNLRSKAGVIDSKNVLCVIPKGTTVTFKNTSKIVNGVTWHYVTYNSKTGYASSKYLKKV